MEFLQIAVVIVTIGLLLFIAMLRGNRSTYDVQSLKSMAGLKLEWNRDWIDVRTIAGHLHGTFEGRKVDIQESRGFMRSWKTTYTVSHDGGAAGDLMLYSREYVLGKLLMSKRPIIPVGELPFDDEYLIQTDAPEAVRAIFGGDANLRNQLLARRVVELRIASGEIIYEERGRMRNAARVQTVLDMLKGIASKLEA